jgi:hypothetical protein
MKTATDFIRANLATYGLLGSNNALTPDLERARLPQSEPWFTSNEHFRFGYDGGEFNSRTCASGIYWTSYGRATRPFKSFRDEFNDALLEIASRHGNFSISATGGYITQGAIYAAKELGLSFEQVVIQLEGYRSSPIDPTLPTRIHKASWEEFTEFAYEFSDRAGCADPWVALEAFHGEVSGLPHVYDGAELQIQNSNFDEALDRKVGPATWSLVDNEMFTAINRWLIVQGRPGYPQILRWSPEIIAAQIASEPWLKWLQYASRPDVVWAREAWPNQAAVLFYLSFPGILMAPGARLARFDTQLEETMKMLGRSLRRANPGCSMQHHSPLHRLLERLDITIPLPIDSSSKEYGHVAA